MMQSATLDDYLKWRSAFAGLLDPELYPLSWLDEQLATGEFVLFSCTDAAILVSTRVYPSGLKEIHGEAAVGNLATIVGRLIPLAEQHGKHIGCAYASIASREGWSREMRQHGYVLHQTTIRKAL